MDNKISVLMSIYNEPIEWIEQSVRSILKQQDVDIELIIVVDNPRVNIEIKKWLDGMASEDDRMVLIYNSDNMGLPTSMNKALETATGEYIARMDADDISEVKRLYSELKRLVSDNLDIISSQVRYIDEKGEIIGVSSLEPRNPITALKYRNNINHPTVLMKSSVLRKLSGYRDMINSEDYDLWLRALDSGFSIGIINEYLLLYRHRKGSISNSRALEQFYSNQYVKKLHSLRIKTGNDNFSREEMERYVYTKSQNKFLQRRYQDSATCLFNAIEKKRAGNWKYIYDFLK